MIRDEPVRPSPEPSSETGPGSTETSPAEPPKPRRAPAILTYIGIALMLVGLIDPLEGIFVIAPGAVLVAIAAFMLGHRTRWWFVGILAFLVVSAVAMGFLPEFWNMALFFVGWMGGILALIVLGALMVGAVIRQARPEAAGPAWIAIALVMLVAVLGIGRVLVLLTRNDQQRVAANEWHEWTTGTNGTAKITLSTVVFWGPAGTSAPSTPDLTMPWPSGGPARVTVVNTSGKTLDLPASAVLDIVVRDDKGTAVFDASRRYWGGSKFVLPWERGATLEPGAATTQVWDVPFEKKGVYLVTAEVRGGPLDGLKSEPFKVTVESDDAPR